MFGYIFGNCLDYIAIAATILKRFEPGFDMLFNRKDVSVDRIENFLAKKYDGLSILEHDWLLFPQM